MSDKKQIDKLRKPARELDSDESKQVFELKLKTLTEQVKKDELRIQQDEKMMQADERNIRLTTGIESELKK